MIIYVLLSSLLLMNAIVIYFTFNTWYGQKNQKKMVAYTIDENGNLKFELDDINRV